MYVIIQNMSTQWFNKSEIAHQNSHILKKDCMHVDLPILERLKVLLL